MADIAFIETPPELVLTGNQINFKVAAKNAFSTGGVQAVVKICSPGTGSIAVGKYLRFEWNGLAVEFICAAVPTGYQFPAITKAIQLIDYLPYSALLTNDFIFSVEDDYYLVLTARRPGPKYALSISTDQEYGAGFGFFWGNRTTGVDPVSKNFKICLKPEVAGDFITASDLPVRKPNISDALPNGFDSNTGVAETYEFEKLFQEYVSGNFTFPEPNTGYYVKHALIKSFRLYAFAKDGMPATIGEGVYSNVIHYLQGKMGNFTQGELNEVGKSFYDKLSESGMFLTLAPASKQTDIYTPERLYFLFLQAGTCKMWSKQYYEDGTTNESIKVTFTTAIYDVAEFFVGYKNIRTNAPKKLVKYEIFLTDGSDDKISEVRTFVIDYRFQAFARYFFLKNSFSVYDCIRMTGRATKTRDTKKSFINIPLASDFKTTAREEKQIAATTDTDYSIDSGYFADKYHAEWFQEFLTSDDVYWLKRGKAYPVSIKDTKQPVSKDGDFNPSCDFGLSHQIHDDFTEEFSANEPIIIADFNPDFNTDYWTGGTEPTIPDPFSLRYVPQGFIAYGIWEKSFTYHAGNQLGIYISELNQFVKLSLFNEFKILAPGTYRVSFDVVEITNPETINIFLVTTDTSPFGYVKNTLGLFTCEFTRPNSFSFDININSSSAILANFLLERKLSDGSYESLFATDLSH